MTSRLLLIAGLSASALILANTIPLPFDLVGSTAAYAKDGNGNGGGNGGGHGNGGGPHSASAGGSPGNSGNHGGSSGVKKHGLTGIASHGHGKLKAKGGSATGKAHVKTDDSLIAGADPTEKEKSLNARAGALHAVNANLQAFIHASPKSRVGKLAAYAQALAADQNLEDAEEALDALGIDPTQSDQALAELLDPLNPTPPTAEQIAAINALLAARSVAQQTSADELLAAAANKQPVDDDVKDYVDGKLMENGILDYYKSLPTTPTDTASQ